MILHDSPFFLSPSLHWWNQWNPQVLERLFCSAWWSPGEFLTWWNTLKVKILLWRTFRSRRTRRQGLMAFMKRWKRCEGAWTFLKNQENMFHYVSLQIEKMRCRFRFSHSLQLAVASGPGPRAELLRCHRCRRPTRSWSFQTKSWKRCEWGTSGHNCYLTMTI